VTCTLVPVLVACLAQSTVRVSVDTSAGDPNNSSRYPSISGDGRYVAFESYASDLVPGDTNNRLDCFVYDRVLGTTTRVSVNSSGVQGNDDSHGPVISSDGTFVVFSSYATNLVNGDTNKAGDVFLHDMVTGQTTRPGKDSSGGQLALGAWGAGVSSGGRYVAFATPSPALPSDTNARWDVYLRDRTFNTLERLSVSSTGGDPDGDCSQPVLSKDGTLCTFESSATNLVAGDTNGWNDVYARDWTNGVTLRVSLAADGTEPNDNSYLAAVSGDDRFVAFTSLATNLVAGDGNFAEDVFLKELATGALELVSVDSTGQWIHYGARDPSVSSDGRFVAFDSLAYDAVDGDTNGDVDVFVRDRHLGMTTRVSVADDGSEGNQYSNWPAISDDGSVVAFESVASNLVPNDTDSAMDVFVRERNLTPATWTNYGAGLAGTKGVPNLVASANPTLNTSITLDLDDSARWYTVGILAIGVQRASVPGFGGTLLVDPIECVPVALAPGTLHWPADVPPDELLAGSIVDVQGLEVDAGAPQGVSLSPGLELVLGF
jgi:Tol biopolymer transport system component